MTFLQVFIHQYFDRPLYVLDNNSTNANITITHTSPPCLPLVRHPHHTTCTPQIKKRTNKRRSVIRTWYRQRSQLPLSTIYAILPIATDQSRTGY
jgi:hypothetical protein